MDFKLENVLVSLHSLKPMGLGSFGASAPLCLRNGELLGHSPIRNVCKQSVNSLKSFIKTNKLIDVWRIYNENRQQFTWRRKDKTQASRIDMILLGKDLLSLVHTLQPAIWTANAIRNSDHIYVTRNDR